MSENRRDEDGLSRREVLGGLGAATLVAAGGLGCTRDHGTEPRTALEAHEAPEAEEPGPPFPVVDVAGPPREIGRAMGEQMGDRIRPLLEAEPSFPRCVQAARGPLRDRVSAFLEASRAALPQVVEEIEGLAEGLDIPFDDLFAWHCRSEISAAESSCPPGCSTVGLCRGEAMILAHNEDGAESYLDAMFVVRATPPSGIGFAALVYPGTIASNAPGVNARGIAQTTNYISPCEVADGIPRYLLGRAVLEAETLERATELVATSGRAFPWNHNLASLREGRLRTVETWPGRHDVVDVQGTMLHTNHLTHAPMQDLPEREDYLDRSSGPRMESLRRSLEARPFESREDLVAALTDHTGEPCRVCRHRGDEVPGVTVAAAVFESPRVEMLLLAGPPCEGRSMVVRPPA